MGELGSRGQASGTACERFFEWLETKAYKMHIRVLLSKYRAYTPCTRAAARGSSPMRCCGGSARARMRDACSTRCSASGRAASASTTRHSRAARAHHARPDAAADRSRARVLRALALPAPLDEATDLLLGEIRARLALPVRRRPRLSHARPPVAHALGRRSAAHQPDDRARHLARQHAVRARRAVDRPASARHGPRDRRDAAAARRRQLAGRRRARPADHAGGRPHARHRARARRARRRDRVLRHAGASSSRRATRSPREYLAGASMRRAMRLDAPRAVADAHARALHRSRGAREHNLKSVDVEIPAASGSCASPACRARASRRWSQDVLYPALLQAQGKPTEAPGAHRRAARRRAGRRRGAWSTRARSAARRARIPRATSARSMRSASCFAARAAREGARLHAGTFSFNSGNGRCPTCSGNGFEHVEMQFLSDVYLRCPDCDGRRYRAEMLEITSRGATARAQHRRRARHDGRARRSRSSRATPRSRARLQPLVDVGLEYLRLGQPVPTLSGGEAQRLKLAGHLAAAAARRARASSTRQAVPVRRADHRPALRRRREAAARVPQAARGRHSLRRDRAQPRRDPRRRLDHRPRPRRRRRRRRDRVAGTPARGDAHARIAHRQGAARVRQRASASVAQAASARARAARADSGAAARPHAQRDRDPQRARAQPARTSTSRFRATRFTVDHRRVRLAASPRSPSTSSSPRASAAISNR